MCCSGIDDRTLPRKNQAGTTAVRSVVAATVFLVGVFAQGLAAEGPENSSIDRRLPGQPGSGGRTVSGTAREAVGRIEMGFRELFLDDVMVARTAAVERILHQPTKYPRNPVIRHHQRPWQKFRAQLYGTVLYIPEEKLFKMWYLAGPRFPDEAAISLDGKPRIPNFQLLAYAESRDGLNWTLPDLGLVSFNGSRHNNLCRFSRENAEGVAVVYDRCATLRRDGFVSMRAGKTPGQVLTRVLKWPAGRRLHVNVDARKGQLRVAVLGDDAQPLAGFEQSRVVSGDHTDVAIQWAGADGKSPSSRLVQLRFELTDADLYSYWLK